MGRYYNILAIFDEVNILLKYLYISEEHFVEFKNSIGVPFRMWMDDKCEIFRKNLNFSDDVPPIQGDVTHLELSGIVDQLKKQPAVVFPDQFESRWEEVKTMYINLAGFNYMHQQRMNGH